jgi:cytochrome c peroxidase
VGERRPGRNRGRRLRRFGWAALAAGGLLASAAAADLTVEIEPRWRGRTLAVPVDQVANESGQTLRVTRCAALLSGFALRRADGGSVRLEGQPAFVDAGTGRLAFTLRGVPEGEYRGFAFDVGLPPVTNHADPGAWPPGHPLNPLVNALHWSWQGGYVFAALEGLWRDGGEERGFQFHVATDALRRPLGFDADLVVRGPTTVRLAWDVGRVLGAHRLAAADGSDSTHSGVGDDLAPRLAEGLCRAWFWLGVAESAVPVATATTDAAAVAPLAGTPWAFVVPAGFPQPALPDDNPLTAEGVALGEVLFGDPRLAGNGAQSCAGCHDPAKAFSDSAALSRGAEGRLGRRNAMPLFNLAWSPAFAWDGAQPRIRDQARAAWIHPDEMQADPAEVVARLARDEPLRVRFAAAFGSAEITAERILLALEQFLLTRVSADSRFDRALRGAAELTEEERRGFALFTLEHDPVRGQRGADCFHCHGGPLFTDYQPSNNGLDPDSGDRGREAVTGAALDRGKFKTPSLRNVALTGPYMHDGRFSTLEDVVEHYDHGVRRSGTLDPNLAKHPPAGMALPAEDRRALVAFLRTLTDVALAEGPRTAVR